MSFILGIIVGLLVVISVLVLDIYLWVKRNGLTDRLVKEIEVQVRLPAQIIKPPNPQQEALNKIFKKNDELGLDTKIEDYL